jgi:hypothetical protein
MKQREAECRFTAFGRCSPAVRLELANGIPNRLRTRLPSASKWFAANGLAASSRLTVY